MQPFFLPGARGPLFCVYHPGAPGGGGSGLLYLAPFAEEMNRARRMAALQARRLAARGVHVLLLDPYGTGDSAGDFGEATWELWRDDAAAALRWLTARCAGDVGLWGLRLGALLAAEVAQAQARPLPRLLLWQPVVSGERFLTQFLRLRVAAGMGQADGGESTQDLRARLARGEALEVGGYEVAPALAEAIAGLKLAPLLAGLREGRPDWIELGSGEALELPPGSRAVVDALAAQGLAVAPQVVPGDPFWAIQEFTLAPALLEATDRLFPA